MLISCYFILLPPGFTASPFFCPSRLLFLTSGPSGRAAASWSMDSGSDDSHRWSDTLSIDEKDGFVFVNYSEGLNRSHMAHPGPAPSHPMTTTSVTTSADPRTFNQLRAGWSEGRLFVKSVLTWQQHIHHCSLLVGLCPGHKWERQLVFRSKLTMHTAFDRKDNLQPAEITALAISKYDFFLNLDLIKNRSFTLLSLSELYSGITIFNCWICVSSSSLI